MSVIWGGILIVSLTSERVSTNQSEVFWNTLAEDEFDLNLYTLELEHKGLGNTNARP